MTEKYFKIKEEISGDNEFVGKFIDSEAYIILDLEDACDVLNALYEENEQLKQQLLYDGDGVCDICKHEYLTPSGNYFISNCRKGHEECSKEDLRYCKDFEVKELRE